MASTGTRTLVCAPGDECFAEDTKIGAGVQAKQTGQRSAASTPHYRINGGWSATHSAVRGPRCKGEGVEQAPQPLQVPGGA